MSSFPQNISEYRHNQVLPVVVNPLNVKSLKVSSLQYVDEFLALYRFAAFSQLRSVYLNNAFVDKATYVELLDQLTSLKYLQSLSIAIRTFHDTEVYFYSVHEEKMATTALTDIFLRLVFLEQRIPSLKRLQLHEDVTRLPSLPSALSRIVPLTMKIEHLTMDRLHFDVLIKLVPYLQQVKSVRISYLRYSNDSVVPYAEQLPNCIYFNASVALNLNTREFDQIEFLLKILSVVEKLHLRGFSVSVLKIATWAFLLSNFCPKLLKLALRFANRLPFREDAEDAQKTLNSSSFWLDRQARSMYDERRSEFNVGFDLEVSSM
jgi:hypothetical protein